MDALQHLISEVVSDILSELNEGREHTISSKEMEAAIERLPQVLRQKFPDVGFAVTRARKEILPFDLKKVWAVHPEVFVDGDNIHFGLHLGDGYREKVPSKEELEAVAEYIDEVYLKRRGWRALKWNQTSQGETLYVEAMPEKTGRLADTPEVLFHLTDTENIPSIKQTGLKPRASTDPDRRYTSRVYLFADPDLLKQQIEQNIEAHQDEYSWNPKLTKTLEMSVVRIDKNKLRQGTKFYRDPEFSGGDGAYYTFTHIPSEAILSVEPV